MTLTQLPKVVQRSKKRVGRGYGSGKGGHTTGRGQKGQKSRGKIPLIFEGRKMKKSLIKRLPFQRGKAKFKPWSKKPYIFNLSDLANWPKETPVTLENLKKAKLVPNEVMTVKLLGKGELSHKLDIQVPTSKSVAKKYT